MEEECISKSHYPLIICFSSSSCDMKTLNDKCLFFGRSCLQLSDEVLHVSQPDSSWIWPLEWAFSCRNWVRTEAHITPLIPSCHFCQGAYCGISMLSSSCCQSSSCSTSSPRLQRAPLHANSGFLCVRGVLVLDHKAEQKKKKKDGNAERDCHRLTF